METQERILDIAETLFFKYGIKSVSMDNIATELGISKKTIYQHFNDKDSIVHTVFSRHIEAEKCDAEKCQHQAKDPIEEIFLATESLRKSLTDINPSVLFDLKKYHTKSWDLFQKFKSEHLLNIISHNLRKGISLGLYRSECKPEILSRLRMEQMEWGFDTTLFPPQEFKALDIQLAFLDHFLRGILTPKGLEIYESYAK